MELLGLLLVVGGISAYAAAGFGYYAGLTSTPKETDD